MISNIAIHSTKSQIDRIRKTKLIHMQKLKALQNYFKFLKLKVRRIQEKRPFFRINLKPLICNILIRIKQNLKFKKISEFNKKVFKQYLCTLNKIFPNLHKIIILIKMTQFSPTEINITKQVSSLINMTNSTFLSSRYLNWNQLL